MVQLTHLGCFSGHPVTSNGVKIKICESGSVKTHNIKGLKNTNDKKKDQIIPEMGNEHKRRKIEHVIFCVPWNLPLD